MPGIEQAMNYVHEDMRAKKPVEFLGHFVQQLDFFRVDELYVVIDFFDRVRHVLFVRTSLPDPMIEQTIEVVRLDFEEAEFV